MNSDNREQLFSEGYQRALALLHECSNASGFLASTTERYNYHRVWARDGVILGLAALMADDHELITTFRRTLLTLAQHQGPHGETPSNVGTSAGRVSYGGTTGRVDGPMVYHRLCAILACYGR